MFIENLKDTKDSFLEIIDIIFIKSVRFYIRLNFIIFKIFIIALNYYLRFNFLKLDFQLCYCQQTKIRQASLENITMFKVTEMILQILI